MIKRTNGTAVHWRNTSSRCAAGLPRVYLVGFSYGGYMALWQAIRTPERVAGMTLLDPAAFRVAGLPLYEGAQPAMVPLTDEDLAAVEAPARILFGRHSTMQDSAAVARRLARVSPAIEVDLVPATGQAIAPDVPGLVNARILDPTATIAG